MKGTLREFLYDIPEWNLNKVGCLCWDGYSLVYNGNANNDLYIVASDGILKVNNDFDRTAYFGE